MSIQNLHKERKKERKKKVEEGSFGVSRRRQTV
jgi:hypothetical protein